MDDLLRHLTAAAVFSLLGVAFFAGATWVMVKILPFSVKKEIAEDQNTALAVVMGSIFLGIAIIVAASVNG